MPCSISNEGKKILITQPYLTKNILERAGIYKWAEERGLEVILDEQMSWSAPGSTILIQIELATKDKALDYINAHKQNC